MKAIFFLTMCAATMLAFPTSSQAQYTCEIPTRPPAEVRKAFAKHHKCSNGHFDPWLKKYPEEVKQLEALYQAWRSSRTHDLRGTKVAANWVRNYPVKFTDRKVELTAAQVETLLPLQNSDPVLVEGGFERLFVDRDNRRLFLTSAEEGLVSINIAKRYAFQKEGKVGAAGAKDFFILDATTAVLEEPNPKGGNRDLVVLDISDRENPKEIARLVGAIPEVTGIPGRTFHAPKTRTPAPPREHDSPPTFDQYRMMREGTSRVPSCGALPDFKTSTERHRDVDVKIHCRPDGSCYTTEYRENADTGICTAIVQPEPMGRPMIGRSGGDFSMDDGVRFKSSAAAPTTSSEKSGMPRPSVRSQGVPEPIPDGGSGGAGSLSQMMLHGKTLYVLSASHSGAHGWLTSFDLTQKREPKIVHVMQLNNGPEALQRHDNLLLVAGRDAVITASLGIQKKPRLLGEFRQDCPVNYDPIVVQGSIGYRTIIVRGRRINCTSRLEVIDLSRPHQPILRHTVPLSQPRGLAVMGKRLYIADQGFGGVKIFDITDEVIPEEIGMWGMPGVKDLVLSDFDLYAMSGSEVQTFFVGPLYQKNSTADVSVVKGITTVKRK